MGILAALGIVGGAFDAITAAAGAANAIWDLVDRGMKTNEVQVPTLQPASRPDFAAELNEAIVNNVPEQQIVQQIKEYIPWKVKLGRYNVGDIVIHNVIAYRCRQSHDTYGDHNWAPGIHTQALWEEIL